MAPLVLFVTPAHAAPMTPTASQPASTSFADSSLHISAHAQVGGSGPSGRASSLFDTCQVGVVLRVVLFVETAAAVGAMFDSTSGWDWLLRFAVWTGGVLPATLVWLLATCALKVRLNRLTPALQGWLGVSLGVAAGVYGCAMLALMGMVRPAPWWSSAAAGAWLSGMVLAWLFWRAKARTPAATAARLAELQSRIRPHFLFNTLNSAIALVREDPAKAETMLENLAELFRYALAAPTDSVTLEEEVGVAERYLAIEQIRFGERLQVQWDLAPEAGKARLPPLLLQPLVENAVKHGVEPSAKGARIVISTARRGSKVVIKVTNTTPAGVGTPGNGLALANVRDRLYLLHDVQARFQTVFKSGVFQVRLEVPI